LVSPSVRRGRTGMMKRRVSIPPAASARIASKRRSGRGARGSRRLASASSSVVIEKFTAISERAAISWSSTRSRRTSVDFVVMDRRTPGTFTAPSSTRRVTSNFDSAG